MFRLRRVFLFVRRKNGYFCCYLEIKEYIKISKKFFYFSLYVIVKKICIKLNVKIFEVMRIEIIEFC